MVRQMTVGDLNLKSNPDPVPDTKVYDWCSTCGSFTNLRDVTAIQWSSHMQ